MGQCNGRAVLVLPDDVKSFCFHSIISAYLYSYPHPCSLSVSPSHHSSLVHSFHPLSSHSPLPCSSSSFFSFSSCQVIFVFLCVHYYINNAGTPGNHTHRYIKQICKNTCTHISEYEMESIGHSKQYVCQTGVSFHMNVRK
jgi:hypothetical protein